MNPLIVSTLFGFVLMGIGAILLSCVKSRTMAGIHARHESGKFWGGLICLFLGLFIMIAPMLPFIFR